MGVAARVRSWDAGALAAVLLVVLAFYVWTATSSGNPIRFDTNDPGYFNQLTDGFLDGQLSLPTRPPPGLLALRDPYDPDANEVYRQQVHDLSLYHGRYYLYWGPTPVLTLFLPWRILPVGELPQNLAVVVYAFVGLIFSVLLMRFLVRRFVPDAPTWQLAAGAGALAFGNVAPWMLRRPLQYEVAIAAGSCFLFAGLFLLLTGALAERRSQWRLAAGSLCLGLAVGARPDLVLAGPAVLAVWLYLLRSENVVGWGARVWAAIAPVGPFLVVLALLLVYNRARFGSFFEFGERYQLAGVEVAKKDAFNLAYVVPGLYYYLLAPVRWSLAFPYFFLPPPPGFPGHVPRGYTGVEATGGLIFTTPIVLALLGLPFALRRRFPRELAWTLAGLAALGLALVGLLAFALWGATMRYEADFAPLLIVVAVVGWIAASRRGRARRAVAPAGMVAIAYGIIVAVAISLTGYADSLRNMRPATYQALEDVTSPLPTLATVVAGHPAISSVTGVPFVFAKVNYTTVAVRRPSFFLTDQPAVVTIVAPGDDRSGLAATFRRGSSVPRGAHVEVVASLRGQVVAADVTGASAALPLRLQRGLNRVRLSASVAGPLRPAPVPGPPLVVAVASLALLPAQE